MLNVAVAPVHDFAFVPDLRGALLCEVPVAGDLDVLAVISEWRVLLGAKWRVWGWRRRLEVALHRGEVQYASIIVVIVVPVTGFDFELLVDRLNQREVH